MLAGAREGVHERSLGRSAGSRSKIQYNKSREQPHFPIFKIGRDNKGPNDREGTQV
jgi:hypothetical protein